MKGSLFLKVLVSFFLSLLSLSWHCGAMEMMFELPDRDTQCFYEDIDKGVSSTLEYQVRGPCTRHLLILIDAHPLVFQLMRTKEPVYFSHIGHIWR